MCQSSTIADIDETFTITDGSFGATITVRRTGEEEFACEMLNCSCVFPTYTKNLNLMQSHAKAKHNKLAAAPVNLTAGSGSRQVGDTITVAVAFGKAGGVVSPGL